jgi:hypothetical protein
MKVSRRAIMAGSVIALATGWLMFDLFENAAGYYSPNGNETPVAAAKGSSDSGKGPSGERAKEVQLASINPLSGISVDSLQQTIERPLFNQSRAPKPKPQPQVAQVAQEPEATADDFTLLGVVVTDDTKTALVRYNKTNETYRLKAGESFSDWQVTDIGPKGVVVKNAELSFPLRLFNQPGQGDQEPAQAGQRPAGQQPANGDDQSDGDNSDDQPEAVSRLEQ